VLTYIASMSRPGPYPTIGLIATVLLACGSGNSFDASTLNLAKGTWQATVVYHGFDSLANPLTCTGRWRMTIDSFTTAPIDPESDWATVVPPEATISCNGAPPSHWWAMEYAYFEILQRGDSLFFIAPTYGGFMQVRILSPNYLQGAGPFKYLSQTFGFPPATFEARR
jgi:hypothetical protein